MSGDGNFAQSEPNQFSEDRGAEKGKLFFLKRSKQDVAQFGREIFVSVTGHHPWKKKKKESHSCLDLLRKKK